MKHVVCGIFFLLFITTALVAQTADTLAAEKWYAKYDVSFQRLPKRMIPVFTADARAHRLQLLKTTQGTQFFTSMGMQFPLVNINALGKTLQFSVASSVYATLKRYTKRGETVNVDYFVDFFFDLKLSQTWYLRSSYGHTSQHLSDDAINAGLTPINYVKDYVQLHSVHRLLKNKLLLYGGFYYFHNYKIGEMNLAKNLSGSVLLHAGGEITLFQFNPSNAIYAAADIKLREEFDFGNTHCLQLGYKLHQSNQEHFRLAYQYLGGYEERGQFYKQQTNLHTIGAYFDF
jgi:hypothetical protein